MPFDCGTPSAYYVLLTLVDQPFHDERKHEVIMEFNLVIGAIPIKLKNPASLVVKDGVRFAFLLIQTVSIFEPRHEKNCLRGFRPDLP